MLTSTFEYPSESSLNDEHNGSPIDDYDNNLDGEYSSHNGSNGSNGGFLGSTPIGKTYM